MLVLLIVFHQDCIDLGIHLKLMPMPNHFCKVHRINLIYLLLYSPHNLLPLAILLLQNFLDLNQNYPPITVDYLTIFFHFQVLYH